MARFWYAMIWLAVALLSTIDAVDLEDEVARLKGIVASMARQTMQQQVYTEERTRSGGHSGLKQARSSKDGTRAFHSSSHISHSTASMHDHADHYKTVGIGEFVAVLNGVEFRTRHNDYMLRSPSMENQDYRNTTELEFPEVPPEVLAFDSIEDQVEEMKQWFKAFADQDHSKRDYRKYFKPVVSYLEGMWIQASFDELDEPFESDRHHLNAKSLLNLQEKSRYTSHTGSKDIDENLAFLPTTIMDVDADTATPTYSQWTYRILSHELSKDLPTKFLVQTGELHKRLALQESFLDFKASRSARFHLNDNRKGQDYRFRWGLLESIMNEVPGLNNYKGDLKDKSFDQDIFSPWGSQKQEMNAAFYHRWYIQGRSDAMGNTMSRRGFSDRNMFTAFTDHTQVTPVSAENCHTRNGKDDKSEEECNRSEARVSWAIPLEIVYMTPLHRWNPYNIEMKDGASANEVKKGGRNGGFTKDKALNGNNGRNFYRTPIEMFEGDEVDKDTADTAASVVGVLDSEGEVRNVTASGVRILLPTISGIHGNIRTRYPIFPIHEEGSTVWKEIEALRLMVMNMNDNLAYFETLPSFVDGGDEDDTGKNQEDTVMYTSTTSQNPPGRHRHSVTFTYKQWVRLTLGSGVLFIYTSENTGHSHKLKLTYDKKTKKITISKCDTSRTCWDGHDNSLYES